MVLFTVSCYAAVDYTTPSSRLVRDMGDRVRQNQDIKMLNEQERLFVSLADGVSATLLQLALLSEQPSGLDEQTRANDETNAWRHVHDSARSSLQLLEGYTLAMRLQGGSAQPEMEPLAVRQLLYDTLAALEPFAKQYSIKLTVDVPGHIEPVVSDRTILRSALLSLGQVFVAAQSEAEATETTIRLVAHRGRYGVVTGWYSHGMQLTSGALMRARKLGGWAQQPYGELVSGSAAGVFIADSLLASVASTLHVARYHNAMGLAVTLPACRQLRLV